MKRARSPMVLGGAIMATLAAVALLAPVLSPYDPRAFTGAPLDGPSGRHLLGTNNLGQDILSQLVWGARSSLFVAITATVLTSSLAAAVGITAGLMGGMFDRVAMRVVDVLLALPAIPFVVVIAALAGPSRGMTILVITLAGWPLLARTIRSQALSLRHRGYVTAAKGLGGGVPYLLRRHLLPGCGPVIVTGFLNWFPVAVFLEAGLAFLGLGDPVAISWGTILNRAINYHGLYFTDVWLWWVLPAGLAITLTVVGMACIGIGLEPRLNPRLRHHA